LFAIQCLEFLFLSASEVKQDDLDRQHKQDSQRLIQVQQQPSKSERREEVYRVADAAVDASCH
jgi:hypothetical protein